MVKDKGRDWLSFVFALRLTRGVSRTGSRYYQSNPVGGRYASAVLPKSDEIRKNHAQT